MKSAFVSPRFRQERAVALLITLAVLVLVTIVAVTYATTARIEGVSARSSFEKQRADALAAVAVDEVIAKLRDNIPTNSQWAAGPGRLYNVSTGSMTPLYSGSAAGSSTGSVALNAPSLSGAGNPILSPNTDFPVPDPMKVAWINVLKDGTLDKGNGANSATPANPAVGRYAYWVDTETSKVNLNTAGRAQTSYYYDMAKAVADYANFDSQNLTASPSRVDLSKLDGGITPAQSKATFDYTNSSYWLGDKLGTSDKLDPPKRAAGQGGHRFDEIGEWVTMTGTAPAVTKQQVDLNQFYLTTRSRSPELNPWGLNKTWWQNGPAQNAVANNQPGNVLEAPGAPAFPPGYSHAAGTYRWVAVPDQATFPAVGDHYADFRYYVYPCFVAQIAKFTLPPSVSARNAENLQWMAPPVMSGAPSVVYQNFIKNMTAQLQRKDWPGMPAVSFQDKYGQRECENLSLNMLYLFENTIYGGGAASPLYFRYSPGNQAARDDGLAYGGAFTYVDPAGVIPPRKIGGVGPWPYFNEVAVAFTPTQAGYPPDPTIGTQPTSTKDGSRPGFCPPISALSEPNATDLYMNVAIRPQIEFSYPVNYPQPLWTNAFYSGINDIEVTASGIFKGVPVTYSGADYAWGYRDDYNGPTGSNRLTRGFSLGGLSNPTPRSTPYYTVSSKEYYIGPFDIGTVPTITTRFRAFSMRLQKADSYTVSQIAPTPPYGTTTSDPVYAAWPGPSQNPETKFEFTASPDLGNPIPATTWVSFEVVDPRCYRYFSPNPSSGSPSDWHRSTDSSGNTLGRTNSGYVAQMIDPLTGQTGDDSKFTWPNMGFTATGNRGPFPSNNSVDARYNQFAGSIQGFPGIGWMSVLPLNTESCLTSANGLPIPWRTLNLGPAIKSDQLPDWLLLNAFAVAYEQTFLSQTDGKINVNARVEPFGFDRLKPLEALLNPSSANPTTNAAAIAADLANATAARSGPCGALPADMYVYPGQICQVPSLQGSGADQFQREALMRDLAGIVTTQSSDFKVHVIAQALNAKGVPMAEQRIEAIVSRTVDVGPDQVPATADDMAGPDGLVGTTDDLKFLSNAGSPINSLKYDGTDPPLEEFLGRPPFKFQITSYRSLME